VFPTLDRTPELDLREPLSLYIDLREFLLLLIEFLNTLVKKKPYYKLVFIKEAKLKKKINGNVGE